MAAVAAFFWGLVVGSFSNVCIWRLPREEQVVRGRSHCPACGRLIVWYDNLPLLSFALLRGRCRGCRGPISWRYPAVELLSGLGWAAVVASWGPTPTALVYGAMISALIVVSFIDAKEQIIPDVVTLPGLGLAVVASVVWPALHGTSCHPCGLWAGVLGALAGGGAIYAMGTIGQWLFKKEAMGGGDVKLMAMLGAILGWQKILIAFFIAPILGSLVGLPLRLFRGQELIPYGPFLAIATVLALWWGQPIVAFYAQLLGGH